MEYHTRMSINKLNTKTEFHKNILQKQSQMSIFIEKNWSWRQYSEQGIALHKADPGMVPATPYIPLNPSIDH